MRKIRQYLLLACLLCWAGVGKAQQYVTANTVSELQGHIANVNTGSLINPVIRLKQGELFQLTTTLNIGASCTIEGGGATLTIIGNNRILDFGGGGTLAVRNLHITGGNASDGSAIMVNNSNLILEGCEINNCYNSGKGAVSVNTTVSSNTVNITNCYIHNNLGDGIDMIGNVVFNISNSTFSNPAASGPQNQSHGVYAYDPNNEVLVTQNITNCTFFGNNTDGVFCNIKGRTINIKQCTFHGGFNNIYYNNSSSNGVLNLHNSILSNYFDYAIGSGTGMYNGSNIKYDPLVLVTTLQNRGGFAPVLPTTNSLIFDGSVDNTIPTDQRGAEVSDGQRDVGAYEFNGQYPLNSPALTVYNTNPFGFKSLYQAIVNANNNSTASTITFNLDVNDIGYYKVNLTDPNDNRWRIKPVSGSNSAGNWSNFIKNVDIALPDIVKSNISIIGEATQNTASVEQANTAKLKIDLDGSLAINKNCFNISGNNVLLEDLNIHDFAIGVNILNDADNITVRGCFIGTDITGLIDKGNSADGIFIGNGAKNVTIGGANNAHQNLISGSFNAGIGIGTGSSLSSINIKNNAIGVKANKVDALPNDGHGIGVGNYAGAVLNIGGTLAGEKNLISGNGGFGVYLLASKNVNILGNYIGVVQSGSPLAISRRENGLGGIYMGGATSECSIGEGSDAGINIIGSSINPNIFLQGSGTLNSPTNISIFKNHIGWTDILGTPPSSLGGSEGIKFDGADIKGILITQNSIACNTAGGIDLGTSNENIMPPNITSALANGTNVLVSGTADADAVVEVYVDDAMCSNTVPAQGNLYVGATNADANGNWTFAIAGTFYAGKTITAIQHGKTNKKNTSAFSAGRTVNTPPTSEPIGIGNANNPLLEDVAHTIPFSAFTFTDVEDNAGTSPIPLSAIKIENLPTKGSFTYNGQLVTANTIYQTGSNFIYQALPNKNGVNYDSFTFRVIDSNEAESEFAYTATLNVTPVNDAPTLNIPQQIPVNINSAPVSINLADVSTKGGGADENGQEFSDVSFVTSPADFLSVNATNDIITYQVISDVTATQTIEVTVTLQDNGGVENNGQNTVIGRFFVTVVPNLPTPYNLIASPASATSMFLVWEDDNPNAVEYEIYRADGSNGTTFTIIHTTTSGADKSFTDTGLTTGNYYTYQVRSKQGVLYSDFSEPSGNFVTLVSASPTGLVITAPANTEVYDQLTLTWTDNSTDEAGFRIERYSIFSGTFEEIASVEANTTTFTDSNLLPNVEYTYRVYSFTADNVPSPYSNEAIGTTHLNTALPFPAPPFDLEATAISKRQIDLRWEHLVDVTTVYMIERSPVDIQNFAQIASFVTSDFSTVHTYSDAPNVPPLTAGVRYYYRVRVRTGSGTSAYSDTSSAVPACKQNSVAIVRTDNGREIICKGKSAAMSVVSKIVGATYKWLHNGQEIPDSNFDTFYASETGIYECKITVDDCPSALSVNKLFVAVLNSPDLLTVQENNGELLASIADADGYQWFLDRQIITGATSRSYRPTKAGQYYVVVTIENCVSTSNNHLFGITANEQTDLNQFITLVPNPARLQTELSLRLSALGKYEIRILDTRGKELRRVVGEKRETLLQASLPTNNLQSGIYVVEISLNGRRGYKKLVIEK